MLSVRYLFVLEMVTVVEYVVTDLYATVSSCGYACGCGAGDNDCSSPERFWLPCDMERR